MDIEPTELMACGDINFERIRYDLEGGPKTIDWWQVIVLGFFPRSYGFIL